MASSIIYRNPEGELAVGADDNATHMSALVWRPKQPGSTIVVEYGVYVEVQHDGSRQVLFAA